MKEDSSLNAYAIAAIGVIVFCGGAGLRLYASDMGTTAVVGISKAGMSFANMGAPNSSYQSAMLLANRSNALSEIATILLWTGGALVVLAAIALLFLPYWQTRATSAAEVNV